MRFFIQVCVNLLIAFESANSILENYAVKEFEHKSTDKVPIFPSPSTFTTLEQTTSTFLSPDNKTSIDSSVNVPIRDILSSNIDGNDKIKEKLANALTELIISEASIDYETLIPLRVNESLLLQKIVKASLPTGNVTFYDIKLSLNGLSDAYTKQFACDVNNINAKGEIGLQRELVISAKITATNNSENIRHKGSIFVILNVPTILKLSKIARNNTNIRSDSPTKIEYSNSTVRIEVDNPFQGLAYQSVETFINEIEQPLGDIFTTKLNEILNERSISRSITTCSKIFSTDQQTKPTSLPFFNNYTNIYIISNTTEEIWNDTSLNIGPVVIEGLSNITATDISIVCLDIKRACRDKSFRAKIETGELRGKFELNHFFEEDHNPTSSTFSFVIESVQFESTLLATYLSGYYYLREFNSEVVLKKLQITMSNSNSYLNEKKFVSLVLSKYLEPFFAKSLKNSFQQEVSNKLHSIQSLYNSKA